MDQVQQAPQQVQQAAQPASPDKSKMEIPSDLSKRLSTPSTQQPQQQQPQEPDSPRVEISIDDIKDPVQKSIVQKHLEAKLKEANDKIKRTFGELGTEKTRLMGQIDQLNKQLDQVKNKQFTVGDIPQLINRPDFVQAVQTYQQQLAPDGWSKTQEEWSALSDNDKQLMQQALSESRATRAQLNQMQMSSYHTDLKTQYADYNPNEVEDLITRANSGQLSQKEIFELTYKALKADEKARAAYQMGWEERNKLNSDRMNGATLSSGVQTTTSEEPLQRNQDEKTRSFFKRIAERNLSRITK